MPGGWIVRPRGAAPVPSMTGNVPPDDRNAVSGRHRML